ncbi:hypothetical protein BJX65DRAFT_305422 [Aspergillus insuetus]
MVLAILCTYGGSLSLVALTLGVAGTSYQVGKVCLLNGHRSTATAWGHIFAVAVTSLFLKLLTVLYCVQVVLRPLVSARLWDHRHHHQRHKRRAIIAPNLPRHALSTQQTSSRIRKILIQWRPIGMVVLIAVYAGYVTQAFRRVGIRPDYPTEATEQWLSCLASSSGGGGQVDTTCDPLAARVRINENELLAALFMIAVTLTPSSVPELTHYASLLGSGQFFFPTEHP